RGLTKRRWRRESFRSLLQEALEPVSDSWCAPLLGDFSRTRAEPRTNIVAVEHLDEAFAHLDGVSRRCEERVIVLRVERQEGRNRRQDRRDSGSQRLHRGQREGGIALVRSEGDVARMHQPRHLGGRQRDVEFLNGIEWLL